MTRASLTLDRVVRRLWVVVLCVVLAGVAAALLSQGSPSYTAGATMIVPGGGKVDDPGRATEAQRLASTYAAVLGDDDAVLASLGKAVGRDRDGVRKRLDIVNVTASSVVQVTYHGASRSEALLGAQTVTKGLTAAPPVTGTVAAGTLQTVTLDTSAKKQGGVPALPVGLVLGLALGLVLAVTLDRADARLGRTEDLAELVPGPVSTLALTPAAVAALGERWSTRLAAGERLALVPVRPADRAAAERLLELLQRTSLTVPVSLAAGSLAGEASGEVLTTDAEAVVLVTSRGASVRSVRAALTSLPSLDSIVVWTVLARKVKAPAEPQDTSAPATTPVVVPTTLGSTAGGSGARTATPTAGGSTATGTGDAQAAESADTLSSPTSV